MGFDTLSWFSAVQDCLDGLILFSLSSQVMLSAVGPPVDVVCNCGRILHRCGDQTHHQQFCDGLPPQPKRMEFHTVCGRIFHRQGDFT